MKVHERFDVTNIDHLKAFDHLQKTGTWPGEFWAEMTAAGAEFVMWDSGIITAKLADRYVLEKLDKDKFDNIP